jgi:ABC-type branched-subunit amino acid transport system ATPase component/ABC-type branched-subunit amino acid transport system permease subunit
VAGVVEDAAESVPAAPRRWWSAGGRLGRLAGSVVLLLVVLVPLHFDTSYDLQRIQLTLVYVAAGIALNFAYGYAGQLALGEPIIMAAGAYAAGLLSARLDWAVWQTVPLAIAAAILTSVLLGLPSLRVSGWYFALLTFFGIAVYPKLVESLRSQTGGEDGLTGVRPMRVGSYRFDKWVVYEIILAAAVLSFLAVRNLVRSGWGLALQSMRDHPVAAQACGIDIARAKARVYVFIAIPCGLVGSLFAHSQRIVAPSQFSFDTVLVLIGGVFLGGTGTLWGPVIGVSIFQGITLWLGPFSKYNRLTLGLGVLLAAVVFKGGLVPATRRFVARVAAVVAARRGSTAAPATHGSQAIGRPLDLPAPSHDVVELHLEGIEKSFGGNRVLLGVDLHVRPGEVLGLVGANGSGKTTMLNVASGFVRPDRGRIRLNGRDVTGLPTHRVAVAGLGRTFQIPKLVDELSVADNVGLGLVGGERQRVLATLFRTPGFRRRERERRARAAEVCQFLSFTDAQIHAPAGELALGMKRIVEIGRAIAGDASVVCLDEPAAGLNEAERDHLAVVVGAIARTGRSVLLIEHNLGFVLETCDEILLLRDGVVAGYGHPKRPEDATGELGDYFRTYLLDTDHVGGDVVRSAGPS